MQLGRSPVISRMLSAPARRFCSPVGTSERRNVGQVAVWVLHPQRPCAHELGATTWPRPFHVFQDQTSKAPLGGDQETPRRATRGGGEDLPGDSVIVARPR